MSHTTQNLPALIEHLNFYCTCFYYFTFHISNNRTFIIIFFSDLPLFLHMYLSLLLHIQKELAESKTHNFFNEICIFANYKNIATIFIHDIYCSNCCICVLLSWLFLGQVLTSYVDISYVVSVDNISTRLWSWLLYIKILLAQHTPTLAWFGFHHKCLNFQIIC